MRWRSNTQAEYETAEEQFVRRQDDWAVATDAYCTNPSDEAHQRMIDTHALYVEAATVLSRLRP